MSDPKLLAASRLVACGVNVLPILPRDKRPALEWKHLTRARLVDGDWDEVDRYLSRWWNGTDYGLGVVTGRVSGIVVIDLDDEDARGAVERTCGWPLTVTVKTSKGWHLWFRHPGQDVPNRAHVSDVGLDMRGDGGYVIVPPSIHPSGFEYAWTRHPYVQLGGLWPPLEMPPALLELLTRERPRALPEAGPGSAPRVRPYVEAAVRRELEAVAGAIEGARNDTLNRAAFALARFVASGELRAADLEAGLVAAAAQAGLPEREARATIASALRSRRTA